MTFKKTTILFCVMLFAGNVSPSFVYAATDQAQAKAELSKINSEIKAAEQKHRELREKAQAARQEILDAQNGARGGLHSGTGRKSGQAGGKTGGIRSAAGVDEKPSGNPQRTASARFGGFAKSGVEADGSPLNPAFAAAGHFTKRAVVARSRAAAGVFDRRAAQGFDESRQLDDRDSGAVRANQNDDAAAGTKAQKHGCAYREKIAVADGFRQ